MFGLPADPAFYGLLVLVLGFFFFCYLLIRRTLLSFREGQHER
ncbi:hypothetical protein [Halarchaeum salinum]|uniref:CcmD family protein n=1 Tax=Halarchaeum salinum TaxID=489912 RepID=A0AAV3S6V2_9EURY